MSAAIESRALARPLVGWLPVVEYCAEECRRQHVGPLHVGYMVDAWRIAMQHDGPMTEELIVRLGATIEPGRNLDDGYRGVGVRVGYNVKPDPADVPRLMAALVEAQAALDPGSWYYEFEMVHPFVDGNGRTGKVLFNLLSGTLADPIWPPDYFGGIENP